MRAGARTPPTRTALLRARRRLERVRTGIGLLTRKRQALVSELFRGAGEAVDARAAVEQAAGAAYEALWRAHGSRGSAGLEMLARSDREIELELSVSEVWGVAAPELRTHAPVRRSAGERGLPPGAAGPAATLAAQRFEHLTERLLEAAPRELRVRRLARALAATSRQLHVLERRIAPELEAETARVRRVLDEREREDRMRLERLPARGRPAAAGAER